MTSRRTKVSDYLLERVQAVSSEDVLLGKKCFACGGESSTGAGEHVLPRWLQKKYSLNNERLQLLNGTLIPYRQLTIPCCGDCNTTFLSNLENQVQALDGACFPLGPMQRLSLARWLAKILVGILTKEAVIPYDRREPSGGPIIPSSVLEHFNQAQLLIQTARKETKFSSLHCDFPFTLYGYQIEEDSRFGAFDLLTCVFGQSVAIRMGTIGAIFVNDGGLQHHVGFHGPFELNGHRLHPIQFSEIAARVHYKSMLRVATHAYQTVETPTEVRVEQLDVVPLTNETLPDGSWKIFEPWDDQECAKLISKYRSYDYGPVLDQGSGALMTTLVDGEGQPRPSTDFL